MSAILTFLTPLTSHPALTSLTRGVDVSHPDSPGSIVPFIVLMAVVTLAVLLTCHVTDRLERRVTELR